MPSIQPVRRAGRPARFDRERVVAAAVEVLDEHGPQALSMAALAKRLGVTPMALYRVIDDRRDLESALVAYVFADLALVQDPDQPWDEAISRWMHRLRDCWLRHPWAGSFVGSSDEMSPGFVASIETLVNQLERTGLGPEQVAREMILIADVTMGALIGHAIAPLPHAAALSKALSKGGNVSNRARWKPIESALVDYGDDAFFADLVAWTLDRVRAKAAGRSSIQGENLERR